MVEIEEVKNRLVQLGYSSDITSLDEVMIQFCIQSVSEHIQNNCNVSDIPEGLHYHAIDAMCGQFLTTKNSIGQLEGYDLEQGVTAVKLGDTNVSFTGQSSEQKFDTLVAALQSEVEGELECYRKLRW